MPNTNMLACPKCGELSPAFAIRCWNCGEIFAGEGGHTIEFDRLPTTMGSHAHRAGLSQPLSVVVANQEVFAVPAVPNKGMDIRAAVVTFASKAHVRINPTAPNDLPIFRLDPSGSTNEADAFRTAGEIAQAHGDGARVSALFFGDGEPTAGGGFWGDHADAALKEADRVKQHGITVATIGFEGDVDFKHLNRVASSAALCWKAREGNLTKVFTLATQTLTQQNPSASGELVIFLIDESGSMGDGTKKEECEEAVNASFEFLRSISCS